MKKTKISIVGKTILTTLHLDKISKIADISIHTQNPKTAQEVIIALQNAEIAIINAYTPVSQEVLDECPLIQSIITSSAGINHINEAECAKRNIRIYSYPDYCTQSMCEKAFCFILMGLHKIARAQENTSAGRWDYLSFKGRELSGKTLGILGYGKSGILLETMAKSFGMTVLHINSQSGDDDISSLIKQSHVLSLNMRVTDKTKKFLNKERLSWARKDVIIVNVARGQLIDETALTQFLTNNPESHAFLDVLEKEPPAPDTPLLSLPNAFVTPHIAWNSHEAETRLQDEIMYDIMQILNRG